MPLDVTSSSREYLVEMDVPQVAIHDRYFSQDRKELEDLARNFRLGDDLDQMIKNLWKILRHRAFELVCTDSKSLQAWFCD